MNNIDFSEEPSSIIVGTPEADRIFGSRFADKIQGLEGNDSINGYGSDDTISGGDGDDTLTSIDPDTDYDPYDFEVTEEFVLLHGGSGNDRLNGNRSANATLYGGVGDDTLSGAGKMYGQEGDDVYYVYGFDAEIVDTVGRSVIYSTPARSTNNSMAASVTTGALDDIIEAGAVVRAGAGNDWIAPVDDISRWFDPISTLAYGEDGNDTIEAITAYGGNGDDFISGTDVYGGDGNDTLRGGLGEIVGGAGHDSYELWSGSRIDELVDTEGSTSIVALTYDDWTEQYSISDNAFVGRVVVGDGNDFVYIEADLILGGGGNDDLSFGQVVYAGAGNDHAKGATVYGEAGNDFIYATVLGLGDVGDDILIGAGLLRGGEGKDTYRVSRAVLDYDIIDTDDRTIVEGALWTRSTATILTGDAADRIEIGAGLVRSGLGDDTVRGARTVEGGEGNDVIAAITAYGESGDDTIEAALGYGGDGDDRIVITRVSGVAEGSTGDDTLVGIGRLYGGEGDDRYEVTRRLTFDLVDLEGTSVILGQTTGARTNLVETADGADRIEIGARVIRSHGGDDTVSGGSEVYGGVGNDSLSGHVVIGEAGDDTISAVRGFGGDDDDVVYGRVVARGGDGNDSVSGAYAFGQDGNDTVAGELFSDGGNGDDVITGGDTVLGGAGNDTVSAGGEVYGGRGNDSLAGQSVFGEAGNDTIEASADGDGGGGSDTLRFTAGDGRTLTGGEGGDTFVLTAYAPARVGIVTVTDFEVGVDMVDLTALEWWRADISWIRNGDDIAIRDGERVTILILETDDGAAFSDLSIVV